MDPQTMTALFDLARHLIIVEPVLGAVIAVSVMVIVMSRSQRPRS